MKNIILKTKHYLFSQTNNKELFFYSLVYSYVLGFIAHAFAFLNLNLCHDYLNEYNIDKFTTIKIGSGRFMQPIIRLLLGDVIVTPWLNGIIGLTMLGLAVYFTLKMFGFDNHITAFVISGIYVTNLTVSVCIGSYMHDFVGNSIGYFLAVFVAYSWGKMTQKFSAARFVFSVLLSTVVLGIYQGIIPVTVVLMMIFSVNEILNGQTTKPALLHLGTGACIISLGALLYFILLKLSFVLTKIKPAFGYATSYAEKNISAKQRVVGSYLNYIWHFFVPSHSIFSNSIEPFNASTVLLYTASIANIGILIFGIVILIKWILKGQNDVLSKSCAVTVIALISFISSIIYAVTCFSHMITRYSYYLWYVLVIVLFKWAKNHLHVNFYKVATTLSVLLATALLVYNVRISNEIY
ncbi:MAG: glucosyltransferase domain-containing protein, partial [Clostridia bacterium]|nr:glucosyltransferase domain-containing protein [Clostridia bacterium]